VRAGGQSRGRRRIRIQSSSVSAAAPRADWQRRLSSDDGPRMTAGCLLGRSVARSLFKTTSFNRAGDVV